MSDVILRLDTNLATQLDVFQQYEEDGDLCRNLLFYLALKEQRSLFAAEGSVDVQEVAKALGMSEKRLLFRHSSPLHLKRLEGQFRKAPALLNERLSKDNGFDMENKVFDNILENALFRLNTEALRFFKGYRHYVENGLEMVRKEEETFQFLRSLKVRQIKAKNGKMKYVYDYVLSPEFMQNFSMYFNAVNFDHIIALKPKNLEVLYIFLATTRNIVRSKGKQSTDDYSFEKLCSLAGINYQFNSNATTKAEETQHIRNQKRALNKKFQEIDRITRMGVMLGWKKTGHQTHPYTPEIIFDPEIPNLIDPKQERAKILFQTFCKLLIEKLQELFPTHLIIEDNAERRIFQYFKHETFDPELIRELFTRAYVLNFKTAPPIPAISSNPGFLKYLPQELQKCKNLLEMKTCLLDYNTKK